ncbi:hypothetical protein GCM10009544_31850 [Streptomyces stramineus]|uniref:Uncharacterized protein n=1 Tax=Streptomyces stramineus TaxID=173861 RepID=A0ABN1A4C9_9ACTN
MQGGHRPARADTRLGEHMREAVDHVEHFTMRETPISVDQSLAARVVPQPPKDSVEKLTHTVPS